MKKDYEVFFEIGEHLREIEKLLKEDFECNDKEWFNHQVKALTNQKIFKNLLDK